MKLALMLLVLAQVDRAVPPRKIHEGNGLVVHATGSLLFTKSPCYIGVDSIEVQYQFAKKLAAEKFEEFKEGERPTAFRVHAACHSRDLKQRTFAVENVVAIVDGKPVFPLKLELKPQVQQNAFGAKRTVQDASAWFSPEIFGLVEQPLVLAVVHRSGRVEFELLPADLRYLQGAEK